MMVFSQKREVLEELMIIFLFVKVAIKKTRNVQHTLGLLWSSEAASFA